MYAQGDLTGDNLSGQLMFDERALRSMATDVATKKELAKNPNARAILGEKFLTPGEQGHFPVTIPVTWILQPVLSVHPSLALAAKWAVGVGQFYTIRRCHRQWR